MSTLKSIMAFVIGQHKVRTDGDMINLNDLYVAAGSSVGQRPSYWRRLPSTEHLIDTVSKDLNVKENDIYKTTRGRRDRGGGTWVHPILAKAYEVYLTSFKPSNGKKVGLYALKFSNGIVKVGRSTSLKTRIKRHESQAQAYGLAIIDQYSVETTEITEKELLAFCRGLSGENHIGEYFVDVNFIRIKKFLGWTNPRKKPKPCVDACFDASVKVASIL